MGRLFRVSFIVAFFSLLTTVPAFAGPYMSWGQWTSGNGDIFGHCWDRGPRALQSVGLTAVQDGRFFHGSNDVFTASLICYDLGNRFILTITVAAERSGVSDMTTDQVRDRMMSVIFGTTSANCNSVVGAWNWWNSTTVVFAADGTLHNNTGLTGTWRYESGRVHASWSSGDQGYYTLGAGGKSMTEVYNGNLETMTRNGLC